MTRQNHDYMKARAGSGSRRYRDEHNRKRQYAGVGPATDRQTDEQTNLLSAGEWSLTRSLSKRQRDTTLMSVTTMLYRPRCCWVLRPRWGHVASLHSVHRCGDSCLSCSVMFGGGLMLWCPKTFQSLTVKTERFRTTFMPYCLRHYQ